jgi:hypothetical protein
MQVEYAGTVLQYAFAAVMIHRSRLVVETRRYMWTDQYPYQDMQLTSYRRIISHCRQVSHEVAVHDNGNNHVAICDEDANNLMAEGLIVQMTANCYRCLGSLLIGSSGDIVKIAERL